jgi:predicted  nucleic acid-binding Zn-ribbon protein
VAKQEHSELVDAASQFDVELAEYTRLGELFLKTPLTSLKHLQRANAALADIAACEERLSSAGGKLVQALASTRDRQEQLAKQVVAHVPEIQARNQVLQDLMGELNAVASEVAALNAKILSRSENGDSSRTPTAADARDVSETVLSLSARAEKLAVSAREADLEELATQAHALHQRLQTIGKKLEKAGGP